MAQHGSPYTHPYLFKRDNGVVMKHCHGGFIRIIPNSSSLDGRGLNGIFAQWKVHLEPNGRVKIQNEQSKKYLRIKDDGEVIDCNGGGGGACIFKLERLQQPNQVKLESERFPGKYVAVRKNQNMKIGSGGKMCVISFFRRDGNAASIAQPGQARPQVVAAPIAQPVIVPHGNGKFDSPYLFKVNRRVVIGGPHGNTLRVSPENTNIADGMGQHGGFAHWDVIVHPGKLVQLRSCKTGKYLRICDNGTRVDVQGQGANLTYFRYYVINQARGHVVKLVSKEYNNAYIAIPKDFRVVVGRGGPHCSLTFLKQSGGPAIVNPIPRVQPQPVVRPFQQVQQPQRPQQPQVVNNGGGAFDALYIFKMNNRVVVRGPHGKHLRVNPNNKQLADGQGGQGAFAHWDVIVHPHDLVQLKSCNTGKYLRIHQNGNVIDVLGEGGHFTFFKVHRVARGGPNVVKLASNKFPNSYVAIPKNHTVGVGRGGPHCLLTFMRGSGGMQARIEANQRKLEQIEGQMSEMTMNTGTGFGPVTVQPGQQMVCPLCGGKGHYGTFGWCDASSIHRKGTCVLCQSQGFVVGNWQQCSNCQGKGGQGTFGPCDRWDIHYKHACGACNGYGYLRMQ